MRRTVGGDPVPDERKRLAGGAGGDTPDQRTGDVQGGVGDVTGQAFRRAQELGPFNGALFEDVEHEALPRVLGRNLDEAAARKGDRRGVVEVDRAGVGGGDGLRLEAGFRERDDLRRFSDLERAEEAAEVAVRPLELQPPSPRLDVPRQPSHGIAGGQGGVGDRGMVRRGRKGLVDLRLAADGRGPQHERGGDRRPEHVTDRIPRSFAADLRGRVQVLLKPLHPRTKCSCRHSIFLLTRFEMSYGAKCCCVEDAALRGSIEHRDTRSASGEPSPISRRTIVAPRGAEAAKKRGVTMRHESTPDYLRSRRSRRPATTRCRSTRSANASPNWPRASMPPPTSCWSCCANSMRAAAGITGSCRAPIGSTGAPGSTSVPRARRCGWPGRCQDCPASAPRLRAGRSPTPRCELSRVWRRPRRSSGSSMSPWPGRRRTSSGSCERGGEPIG